MLVFTNRIIPKQPPESEYGNTEYKIYLDPHLKKNKKKKKHFNKLTFQNYIENKSSQMLFRLIEGRGKALYILGVKDDGTVRGMTEDEMQSTLKNINLMVEQIKAQIKIIRVYEGGKGHVCTVRIFLPMEEYNKKIGKSVV